MQQLANLFILLSLLVSLPTLAYLRKHPNTKGRPYIGRPRELMMTSIFLSACCLLVAGFLMFSRP
jgi:hypothetical protein